MGSPCPKCGYLPSFNEDEAHEQVVAFVMSWKPNHRKVFFEKVEVIKALDKKGKFWADCLNFLSRLTNDGMTSMEILQQMMLSLRDPDFIPKIARADRQWPYLAETISRRMKNPYG